MAEQNNGPILWGKHDGRAKSEGELIDPELVFIDETSPLQPYTSHGELGRYWDFGRNFGFGAMPVSDEGYAHNEELQKHVGVTLSWAFDMKQRGQEALEVGYGSNHFVAEGINQQSGIPVCLLDYVAGRDENDFGSKQINPPKQIKPISSGLKRYLGDMADIDVFGSDLAKKRFASVLYNGSWSSTGNNWTVMQILEGHYAEKIGGQPDWDSQEFQLFKERQLLHLLQLSKTHLTPNGVIYIASSRYAFHGSGYKFDDLPEEKLEFLNIVRLAKTINAKRITVFGVSSDALSQMLHDNQTKPDFVQHRKGQAFNDLFGSGMHRESPRYGLTLKGREVASTEIYEISKDPDRLTQLLTRNAEINRLVEQGLAEQYRYAEQIIGKMTGGVASLPDDIEYGQIKPQTISKVKNEVKTMIPNHVGRIDALGLEF